MAAAARQHVGAVHHQLDGAVQTRPATPPEEGDRHLGGDRELRGQGPVRPDRRQKAVRGEAVDHHPLHGVVALRLAIPGDGLRGVGIGVIARRHRRPIHSPGRATRLCNARLSAHMASLV